MNPRKNLILIKNEIKTPDIKSCQYNPATQKMDVQFNNGKTYSYAYANVEWLKEPYVINPNMYQIGREGRVFFCIEAIYAFEGRHDTYWHICFSDGTERDYPKSELQIVESCLNQEQSANVFEYIKQISSLSDLKNEAGEKILAKRFDKISFVGNDVALAKYLNPSSLHQNPFRPEYIPIFPFGCNNSQYKAVKNAMENQISVIQGPPGTGKTQTILNIIANILMQGKTVQIVSNNNSATENVYEKLSSPKYNLGFIAATLGNSENKKVFIEGQDEKYPDFSSWKLNEDQSELRKKIKEKSVRLKELFDKQEELANLKQEQSQLATEIAYFNMYVEETDVDTDIIQPKRTLSTNQWLALWQECRMLIEEKQRIGLLFKIKGFIRYGISNLNFYKQDSAKIITTFQAMYYRAKEVELAKRIEEIESYLKSVDNNLLDDLCNQSMMLLKGKLAGKYGGNAKRTIFTEDDLRQKSYDVLQEYPVILSTTFSSRNSLKDDVVYYG